MHRPVERARPAPCADRAVGGGEAGAGARREHHGARAPGGHAAALEAQMRRLAVRGQVHGTFVGRHGLPGERRLLHGQALRPQKAYVGGDQVAGAEPHHVAGHQLAYGELVFGR